MACLKLSGRFEAATAAAFLLVTVARRGSVPFKALTEQVARLERNLIDIVEALGPVQWPPLLARAVREMSGHVQLLLTIFRCLLYR